MLDAVAVVEGLERVVDVVFHGGGIAADLRRTAEGIGGVVDLAAVGVDQRGHRTQAVVAPVEHERLRVIGQRLFLEQTALVVLVGPGRTVGGNRLQRTVGIVGLRHPRRTAGVGRAERAIALVIAVLDLGRGGHGLAVALPARQVQRQARGFPAHVVGGVVVQDRGTAFVLGNATQAPVLVVDVTPADRDR